MNFRTFSDMNKIINEKIHLIPNDIDLVVGIPRSGMLPSTMISLLKNLPLTDFDSFIEGKLFSNGKTKKNSNWVSCFDDLKKVLIVEDSCCNGNSIKNAKKIISEKKFDFEIIYCAIFCTPEAKKHVDIYMDVVSFPREFEWNYLHMDFLEQSCFDIDGVLCIDPTEEQNDDGEKYIDFLKNTPCRIKPSKKIKYLVTSRLEKYRKETEQWLKENGILYDELIMLNCESKEERIKLGNHGIFKGEVYKSKEDSIMFIESEPKQAMEIANISGKPVFCVGNQTYYPGGIQYEIKQNLQFRIKRSFFARVLRFIKRKLNKRK